MQKRWTTNGRCYVGGWTLWHCIESRIDIILSYRKSSRRFPLKVPHRPSVCPRHLLCSCRYTRPPWLSYCNRRPSATFSCTNTEVSFRTSTVSIYPQKEKEKKNIVECVNKNVIISAFWNVYHQCRAAQKLGWHQLWPPRLLSKWSDDSHLHPTPLSPTEYTSAPWDTHTHKHTVYADG